MSEKNDYKKVSVVIPMWNEEDYILDCLLSLENQDYPSIEYEVLIVDGSSIDHSRDIVFDFCRKMKNFYLIDNPKRITPISLNMGIRSAKGEIIIILGAHSFVESNFIRKNVETLNNVEADCVGGPIKTIGKGTQGEAISITMSSPFGIGNSLFRFSKEARYVDTVAFGAYKREVFDRIGLFDESLVRNQDFELNHRLLSSGGKIYLTPDIKSYYYARSSIWKVFKQYFHYGYWKLIVVKRQPGAFRIRYQIPPLFIVTIFISIIFSFISSFFLVVFVCILSIYILTCLIEALYLSIRKGLKYFFYIFLSFMALHIGFGSGFLYSLIKQVIRKRN